MTLVEIVVALVILSSVLLTLGGFTLRFAQASGQAHFALTANEIAAARLDAVRNQATYSGVDTLVQSNDSTRADNVWYHLRTQVARVGGAVTDSVDYKLVTVTVWAPQLRRAVVKTTAVASF